MPALRVFLLTTVAALAVLPGAASATVFSGAGADPVGDGPALGQDIAAVDASYDDAGSVTASLTLAGEPAAAAPLFVYLQVGTRSGTTCGAPFAALGATTDSDTGAWGLSGDASSDFAPATVTRSGAKVTISASGARLAGGAPDCVWGSISPKATSADPSPAPVDRLDALAPLTAPAPPAPVPAAPAPAPAAPAPAPAPTAAQTTTAAAAAPVKKAPQLAVSVTGVPSTIRRARPMTLTVRVANTGTAAARDVRLRVGTARGLRVRPRSLRLGTVKAGRSTTRRVRVALTAKARATTVLAFTAARAGKVAARGRIALTLGRAKAKAKGKAPGPGSAMPAAPKGPLAGTYWWYTVNHVDWSWDNHGVYFVDDHWAYRGIPAGGLPSCTTQTAGVDAQGEETDGCIPYTYDAATGALTLGAAAGSFKDGTLKIFDEGDERTYDKLVVPDAGARYDVDLLHRSFSGLCGLIGGCTTSVSYLRLLPDGQFTLGGSTTSTFGDPGSGPFTAVGSYPADQHGSYEVQAGGRLHLAFADGSVKDKTFALLTNQAGQPDPVNEGVMLDDDNFYRETD